MVTEAQAGDRAAPRRTSGRRVAVDATPLLGQPTGVGAFCAGLLGGLAERPDVSVIAFAVSWRRRHGIVGSLPAGVPACGRAMPARPLHLAWRHFDWPPLEWWTGPCDVVHGTNFVAPPTRKAARVLTVHDLTVVKFPELCCPSVLAFPGLIKRAVQRGAWVHTPSAFVAGEVLDAFGADAARVRAVHSGVPALPSPGEEETAAAAALLPPGSSRVVLAVATAEPRKDLPGLVRAFDQLAADHPDVALVLAGPPGWGEAALGEAVAASPFAARVVRTGWVDDGVLAALYARASVLAYPSRYEGFGFPPLQAMAAGVPVVATDVGALGEVLGDAAVLVPPAEPDRLAEAIVTALDDDDLRRRLVAAGHRRVATFTWARTAEGLARLYEDAAAARP
ncbi:MAG TPA: glycosyltransferase family 1 protein [Acidimicrobiales bacterium]|nr:glycosyltransferase family 1 protein [Acidimicrobiales bacterium]